MTDLDSLAIDSAISQMRKDGAEIDRLRKTNSTLLAALRGLLAALPTTHPAIKTARAAIYSVLEPEHD